MIQRSSIQIYLGSRCPAANRQAISVFRLALQAVEKTQKVSFKAMLDGGEHGVMLNEGRQPI
jgi:hypothetical protein